MKILLVSPKIENCIDIYDPNNNAKLILDMISYISSNDTSISGIIVGNYGFGKTHLLLYVYNKVNSLYKDPFIIYTNSPKNGILDLYTTVLNKTLEIYNRNSSKLILDKELKQIFDLLDDENIGIYIRAWLYGESIPLKIRRKFGLGGRINNVRALTYMIKMLYSIYKSGYNPILIMIDEFEDILSYNTLKKIRYLSNLRTLIDNLPPHSMLIAASTPAGLNEIVNIYPALSRRFLAFPIYLKPFNRKETKEFVREFICKQGIPCKIFTDEIYDILYEYSEGNPGEIIRLINALILNLNNTGLHVENESEYIDIVKEVLSEYV